LALRATVRVGPAGAGTALPAPGRRCGHGGASGEAQRLAAGARRAASQAESPAAVRHAAGGALLRGMVAHHAGCLPAWKAFVEGLFQRNLLKLVFSTETLAAGINMPARTAVLPAARAGVQPPLPPRRAVQPCTAGLPLSRLKLQRRSDLRGCAPLSP